MTIIDTDSHAVEAPDVWTSRMSNKKWGDHIPHVRYVPEQSSDVWFVGDFPICPVGFTVIAKGSDGGALRNEENFPQFITRVSEMHPSAFDPQARAEVMDEYGIDRAVLYPNLGFIGPDIYRVIANSELEFQLQIARAYNDWVLGWEKSYPDKFISLACIPYWDVPSAVAEVERCAEAGHHGWVMTGVPEFHGEPYLPDPHWNPLWAACQASGLPISFHAGGGGPGAARMVTDDGQVVRRSPMEARAQAAGQNATNAFMTTSEFLRNGSTVADLMTSGILPRFPDLKFISVESGVGWIPFVVESVDRHANKYNLRREHPEFTEPPSYYFHRQVYTNCWYEQLGDYHMQTIGEDRILFETDFPHPTCLIGDEIAEAVNTVTGRLSSEQREKILWRNAEQLFKVNTSA
jgi:predicted TIM-barrel fold metal-dependent hydrolase